MTGDMGDWKTILFGDAEIAAAFSDEAMLDRYLRFEISLVLALADTGLAPMGQTRRIAERLADFRPDRQAIARAVERDGLAVPEFVGQIKAFAGADAGEIVHRGATSQDLIDTATVLALRTVNDLVFARLAELDRLLAELHDRFGKNRLMAVTRMQPALPIKAQDRVAAWRRPLRDLAERLEALRPRIEALQLGGPVGTLGEFGQQGTAVAKALAARLDLAWPGASWHTARGRIAEYSGLISELTGALGKIGQDIALMALLGKTVIDLSDGGGSSAMPHKQNPVAAERLVALARRNATLVSGIHQSLIHEQERSGAAWMLEWLMLPEMCQTAGASLKATDALLRSVECLGEQQ